MTTLLKGVTELRMDRDGSIEMLSTAYLVMTNIPPQKWLGFCSSDDKFSAAGKRPTFAFPRNIRTSRVATRSFGPMPMATGSMTWTLRQGPASTAFRWRRMIVSTDVGRPHLAGAAELDLVAGSRSVTPATFSAI